MANIKKVSDGSFKITVSCGRDSQGKQIRKYLTYRPEAKTPKAAEKEARAYAAKIEDQLKEGKYFSGEQLTYREVYDQWAEHWAPDQLSPYELEQYTEVINRDFMPEFGHMKMNRITALNIQAFIDEMSARIAPSTLKKYFTAFRSVFRYAYRLSIVKEDVCARVQLPRIQKSDEVQAFTIEEAQRFMNDALTREYTFKYRGGKTESHKMPFQFRVLYTLAIYSGCRRGELIGLNWEDIDFNNKMIRINKAASVTKEKGIFIKEPKTKSGIRTLSLPAVCFELLAELEAEQRITAAQLGTAWQGKRGKDFRHNPVFIQADGLRMYPDTVTNKFKEILNLYNAAVPDDMKLPDVHLHNLRHTSASLLVAEGIDLPTIARRLGHSKTSTTLDIYTQAYIENDTGAADTLGKILDTSQEPIEGRHSADMISVNISPEEYDILLCLRRMSAGKRETITDMILHEETLDIISSAAADKPGAAIRS